jgi:hypothetical protein
MLHFYATNQVIDSLCSFLSEDTPSPVPADSISKVLRRYQFREIACPSISNCDNVKQLIQHSLALFEEYHDDVRLDFHLLFDCVPYLLRHDAEFMAFQILALLERRDDSRVRSQESRSSHSREVHLLPIPSDEGCSQHFGSVTSTYRHRVSSDFKNLVVGLNRRNLVVQDSEAAVAGAAAERQQLRRQPDDQAVFLWQTLRVNFPPLAQGNDFHIDVKGQGIRFKPAVPCPEFEALQSLPAARGGGVSHSKKMSKGQKKKARQLAKRAQAADPNPSAESPEFLSPCDIPRVRLFLCYHSDVERDGNLPSKHLEIDPARPLDDSISEFEKKFSGHRLAFTFDRQCIIYMQLWKVVFI